MLPGAACWAWLQGGSSSVSPREGLHSPGAPSRGLFSVKIKRCDFCVIQILL